MVSLSVRSVNDMPKKSDPSLKIPGSDIYKSQYPANERWNAKNPSEQLKVRMPVGMREKLTEYVTRMAAENPGNPKYSTAKGRPSVNALVNTLLAEEMGIELDNRTED